MISTGSRYEEVRLSWMQIITSTVRMIRGREPVVPGVFVKCAAVGSGEKI